MKRFFTALVIGLVVGGVGGFLLGVYALPIIVEWRHGVQERAEAPEADEHDPAGAFDRNSPGSDPLHWGEGRVRVSEGSLVFEEDVRLAPGPDYRVYLSKSFAQTKEEFLAIKPEGGRDREPRGLLGSAVLPHPAGGGPGGVRQRRRVVRGVCHVHRERAPRMRRRGD